jgi:hypothetical protein
MNEQIKEIYSDAVKYAFSLMGVSGIRRELQEVINEKFAELIIQKCTELCYAHSEDMKPRNRQGVKDVEYCAKLMKEYFGVK